MGRSGEERAVEFLTGRGFIILAQNFRYGRYGEIDIVAKKDSLVLFVEVKSRSGDAYGGALYSVSRKKINSLKATARHFIDSQLNNEDCIYRFDMIAVDDGTVSWIEDIAR